MTSFIGSQGLKEGDQILTLAWTQFLSAEFLRGVRSLQQVVERSGAAIVQIGTTLPQAAQRRRIPAPVRAAIRIQLHIVEMFGSVIRASMTARTFRCSRKESLPALRRD